MKIGFYIIIIVVVVFVFFYLAICKADIKTLSTKMAFHSLKFELKFEKFEQGKKRKKKRQ